MALRASKYDELCKLVLERTSAVAAVVIVVEENGPGVGIKEDFSLAGGEYHMRRLPKVLRKIAEEIEKGA